MENEEKTYVDEAYIAEDGYILVRMDDERGGLVLEHGDEEWERMDEDDRREAIDELTRQVNLYRSYTVGEAITYYLEEICDVDPDDFEIDSDSFEELNRLAVEGSD